jgi:hypothetical protein
MNSQLLCFRLLAEQDKDEALAANIKLSQRVIQHLIYSQLLRQSFDKCLMRRLLTGSVTVCASFL